MAETTTTPATTSGGGSPLISDRGKTSIADSVVSKIAGLATREIPGIHAMGSGAARVVGVIRDKLPVGGPAKGATQGVSVEVGERQAAIDLDVVVDYGVPIVDVANAVRDNVASRVERMTGLEVTEVNVTVDDIYVEGEQEEPPAPERVQ
jgi:uncharacterized alkaline shock family protein YloU